MLCGSFCHVTSRLLKTSSLTPPEPVDWVVGNGELYPWVKYCKIYKVFMTFFLSYKVLQNVMHFLCKIQVFPSESKGIIKYFSYNCDKGKIPYLTKMLSLNKWLYLFGPVKIKFQRNANLGPGQDQLARAKNLHPSFLARAMNLSPGQDWSWPGPRFCIQRNAVSECT